MENETYIKRLKDRLQIEFKKQDRSGVYGYTQRVWRIIPIELKEVP